ncbi:MAG: HNH endonuclease [Verrucomicrobiales bacterium]|nr:HNH endonuclease [Verrucomicrobiales bacterium]
MNALSSQVLVLNRLWQPVNICDVKRAVSLLFVGHADVVDTDKEAGFQTHDADSWMSHSESYKGSEVLHSVSHQLRIPSIIVLTHYDRLPKQDLKFCRQTVFERDKFTCQYCGEKFENHELNLDHVIPRQKGGETSWENVVCSCIRCNTRKANKLPAQANMRPLNEPRKPRWRPFFLQASVQRIAHTSWKHFIELPPGEISLSS